MSGISRLGIGPGRLEVRLVDYGLCPSRLTLTQEVISLYVMFYLWAGGW